MPSLELKPFEPEPTLVRRAIDRYYEGVDYELAEQYAKAAELYQQSLDLSPRPVVHYRLGRVHQQLGRLDQARAQYHAALALSDGYRDAIEALRQVAAAEELRALSGDEPLPARRPGVVPDRKMTDRDATPEQMADVEVITVPGGPESATGEAALPPTSTQPLQPVAPPDIIGATLAEVGHLLRKNKSEEAQTLVDKLLIDHADDARVYYYAGNVAADQNDLEAAHRAYQKALELDPTYARAHNNLGIVHEALGRSRLALEHYQRAVELAELPDALYNLAVLHEKRGEIDEAMAAFRRYLTVDPASAWAERARLHIQRLQREY